MIAMKTTLAAKPFRPGAIVSTALVANLIQLEPVFAAFIGRSLSRHIAKDWGDLDTCDSLTNDTATHDGSRLFSAYTIPAAAKSAEMPNDKIWIITEAEGEDGTRESTCILFPSEY